MCSKRRRSMFRTGGIFALGQGGSPEVIHLTQVFHGQGLSALKARGKELRLSQEKKTKIPSARLDPFLMKSGSLFVDVKFVVYRGMPASTLARSRRSTPASTGSGGLTRCWPNKRIEN